MGADAFIDYDPVRDFLKTFPSLPHTDLLDTIVDEIVAKCFENDRVEACRVAVLKPDIFNEAAAAGIEGVPHPGRAGRADYPGNPAVHRPARGSSPHRPGPMPLRSAQSRTAAA